MRISLVLAICAAVLAAAAAVAIAQRDGGPVTGLQATDQQVTINHRIAVGAMARANLAAAGPTALVKGVDSGPISGGTVPISGVDVAAGQSYLVSAWLLVQGQSQGGAVVTCFTTDADGTRGPEASLPVAGVETMTITGVFQNPDQELGLFCAAPGVTGALIQNGQLSLVEVAVD